MLDQLVESKSHSSENNKRGGLLLTTAVLMITVLTGALLYSLFAKDFSMDSGDLSIDSLAAIPVVEEAPQPEPEKPPQQEARQKDPNVDVRQALIARMDETPPKAPDRVSNEASKIPPRDPNKYTAIGDRNYNAANAPPSDYTGPVNTRGTGSDSGLPGGGGQSETGAAAAPPPPPPVKKPEPPKQISGGVLNGKATSLPKPPYPPAARAVRAAGTVNVQVLIDENGNVVSATATSGHPLLKAAAVAAARQAKFSPTKLSGQAVKVSGVISYNFVP